MQKYNISESKVTFATENQKLFGILMSNFTKSGCWWARWVDHGDSESPDFQLATENFAFSDSNAIQVCFGLMIMKSSKYINGFQLILYPNEILQVLEGP